MNTRPITGQLASLLSRIQELFEDATSIHSGLGDDASASLKFTLEDGSILKIEECAKHPSVLIQVPRGWIVTPPVESKVIKHSNPQTGEVIFKRMTREEVEAGMGGLRLTHW